MQSNTKLTDLQQKIITSLVDGGALRFGDFTLKSGRKSPYFFNSGQLLAHGETLHLIGSALAQQLANIPCDYVFGAAYKGIPLACTCVTATYQQYNRSLPWGYNRKEAKTHGEGGSLVGENPKGKIVVIDDVLTSGKAAGEAVTALQPLKADSLLLLLDRQEPASDGRIASEYVQRHFGLQVHALLRFEDIITWIKNQNTMQEQLEIMLDYQKSIHSSKNKA